MCVVGIMVEKVSAWHTEDFSPRHLRPRFDGSREDAERSWDDTERPEGMPHLVGLQTGKLLTPLLECRRQARESLGGRHVRERIEEHLSARLVDGAEDFVIFDDTALDVPAHKFLHGTVIPFLVDAQHFEETRSELSTLPESLCVSARLRANVSLFRLIPPLTFTPFPHLPRKEVLSLWREWSIGLYSLLPKIVLNTLCYSILLTFERLLKTLRGREDLWRTRYFGRSLGW